jgi:hypothetical protein
MHNEVNEKVYVAVYLFRHDASAQFEPPQGLIEARALSFENIANASVVFADAREVIDRAGEAGIHAMTERVKPGKRKAL